MLFVFFFLIFLSLHVPLCIFIRSRTPVFFLYFLFFLMHTFSRTPVLFQQRYSSSQVSMRDGRLRIEAVRQPTSSPDVNRFPYLSGRVESNFAFTYGRVEASIRLPKGAGLWPALWLLPTTGTCWPLDGEIDIAESQGTYVVQTMTWGPCGLRASRAIKAPDGLLDNGYVYDMRVAVVMVCLECSFLSTFFLFFFFFFAHVSSHSTLSHFSSLCLSATCHTLLSSSLFVLFPRLLSRDYQFPHVQHRLASRPRHLCHRQYRHWGCQQTKQLRSFRSYEVHREPRSRRRLAPGSSPFYSVPCSDGGRVHSIVRLSDCEELV